MVTMKSYQNTPIQAVFAPLLKFFASGFRVAIVPWMLFTSCTPNAIQPSIPNPESPTVESGAAQINKALATLALQTGTATADYQIGPEDLLEITLFNVPAADGSVTPRTTTVRVSQEGFISLPLLGEVDVKALTIARAEKQLRQLYDKYIYSPQVGVLVKEFRQRVSVIGAVQKPGVVELTGPKTVTEILAIAGGVSEKAGNQVHIYRQGPSGRESHVIDLSVLATNAALINADNVGLVTMSVQPGDMINVPPAGTFFVDGAVRRPGPYSLGRRYTLTQALATAGGVDIDLYSSDMTIFRRKGASSGMEQISVDYAAVMSGSAVDLPIESDDVIIVPTNALKYVVNRFIGKLVNGVSIGSMHSYMGGS
jgi:polysaccharide biosynthesis/export protein